MGSVLSSAYATLCSFVNAQLDRVEMWQLMASYPQLRDMPAAERKDMQRWIRDQDAEEDARDAAARLRGRDRRPRRHIRCNYHHPVDAVKNKVEENV